MESINYKLKAFDLDYKNGPAIINYSTCILVSRNVNLSQLNTRYAYSLKSPID